MELLDGGTGAFHLISCLRDYPAVLLIDATLDGRAPGTVAVLTPRFLSEYPRSLGAHDVGLRDLLEAATLLGPLPALRLITVSIAEICEGVTELSPPVAARSTRLSPRSANFFPETRRECSDAPLQSPCHSPP